MNSLKEYLWVFYGIIFYISNSVCAQSWSNWTLCPETVCYKSRIKTCVDDDGSQIGFACSIRDEPYLEILNKECTSLCSTWSSETLSSVCSGNCYSSKQQLQFNCLTEAGCTMTQLRKCYNETTCLGNWNTTRTDACSVTCGNGVQSTHQECSIDSYLSYICPGSNGTLSNRTITSMCYNCLDWGNWTDWTSCKDTCTASQKRSCSNTAVECGNMSTVETKHQSCKGGLCASVQPPGARSGLGKDLITYAPIMGAAVVAIVVVAIGLFVVKRRRESDDRKSDEPPQTQTHVREIDEQQTSDDIVRRSFGSHYETLQTNVYANPDEVMTPKHSDRFQMSTKRVDRDISPIVSKPENSMTHAPYSLAIESPVKADGYVEYAMMGSCTTPTLGDANSREFGEESGTSESDDEFDGSDGIEEETTYATIEDIKQKKNAKIRKSKRKTKKAKDTISNEVGLQGKTAGNTVQESTYANESSDRVAALIALGDRQALQRRSTRHFSTAPASKETDLKRERSITTGMLRTSPASFELNRCRSPTFPMDAGEQAASQTVNNPVTSRDTPVENVQYTAMQGHMIEDVEYAGVYTDMTMNSQQIQDEYVMGTGNEHFNAYDMTEEGF